MPTNAVRHQLKTVSAKKHLWLSIHMTNDQGEAKSLQKYQQQFRLVQKHGRWKHGNMSHKEGNKPPGLVPNSFTYLKTNKQTDQTR